MLQCGNPRAFVRPHFGLGSSLGRGTLTILPAERPGHGGFWVREALTVSLAPKWARQEKWGRHCCRPHSHRCVVLLPKKQELGIRCFPFEPSEDGSPVLSPALAPASGSTLQPTSARDRGAEALVFPALADLQRAAPRSNLPMVAGACMGPFSGSEDPSISPSASDRAGPIRLGTTSRVRHQLALLRTEVLCTKVSRLARTGSATSFRNGNSFEIQVVRPSFRGENRSVPMS